MMVPRIAGFRCFQSPVDLVTEMKSEPKNTRPTSGTVKRAAASGERAADSRSGKSATEPSPMTSRPGRNFRVAGFGVDSVWMNMIVPSGEFRVFPIHYMDPRPRGIKGDKKA